MYKKYIENLINGKQIRIRYNQHNHDYCEGAGWWSEELWCYDATLEIFKCYYPISSYEKAFYTSHTQHETERFLKEAIKDFDNKYGEIIIIDIIVEDCCIPNSSLSIREAAIEKINSMSDDEIRNKILI